MSEPIGEVSGEGGPFLILDRVNAEVWRGSDDDGHYNKVFGVPHMTGTFEFDGRRAVAWEAEGAATAFVYRLAVDRVLVQREWADRPGTPDLPATAEEFASVEFDSGDVIVMWAPVAWEDVWEPPASGVQAQLSMPSMLNFGLQLSLPAGAYSFASERTDEAYRCWITPRT